MFAKWIEGADRMCLKIAIYTKENHNQQNYYILSASARCRFNFYSLGILYMENDEYLQTSDISRTKSQKLNIFRLVLQLVILPNPF